MNQSTAVETRPKVSRRKTKLTFVVQKHHTTRLHYDFRVEIGGLLKSWAIPKGPSMKAGEKRLAFLVEDHPLEYGKFYGIIPEGEYGAGLVEIWDKGTYKPTFDDGDPEKSLLKMMEKGDIKLTMNGNRLKGNFALFHLKNKEKDNQWMLVKKPDEFAIDDFKIESVPPLKTKELPQVENIKEGNPPEPFPDPLPSPMLAKLVTGVINNPAWIYEMKLDGYRILCSRKNGQTELVSRRGNTYTAKYGSILEDLDKIEENVILDGEVVVENSRGISDFQLLQNYGTTRKGNLKYYVFDILYLNGHNLMSFPLLKRKELLDFFFKKYDFKRVFKLEFQAGNGKELFKRLSDEGFEGIIAKDPDGVYHPGRRSELWLKIKSTMMQEAVICGFTDPQGGRKYFGSILLGLYENGKLRYIGNCGTGFNDASLRELNEKFSLYITDKSPFPNPPKLSWAKGKPTWLKPELVAKIKFMEWSNEGIMRAPVFMGLREDKNAVEVINETTESVENVRGKKSLQEDSNKEKNKTLTLSGKKVNVTNVTKVFWPAEGYTKGDLIQYYTEVSSYILPYLKDRPQSLNRHPNGIKGPNFYHKDMDVEQIPQWAKTIKLESKTNEDGIDYLICNDTATLIYMANLGCIEINPWHSRYKKPDNPDYVMLDLDPGNISFTDVVNTALVIKEICDETGIQCYCKTSGATGLHIYIPLGAAYDYEQSKTFAEILAGIAHKRLPSTTSIERPVSKRKDKVYIDFLQNRKGQTIAAPYSVRPRPFATVSAPLLWEEVNHQLRPEMFTIKNILQRLEKLGDLWRPVLGKDISVIKALKSIERLSD